MPSSYSLYRERPSWGTNQFRFDLPPPAPSFQPQPSWNGWDFYSAHAGSNPDPSFFNMAWNGANYRDGGVGINEARHWHTRVYGGLGDLNKILPEELGHAAAYEAYRKWMHHSSMREPLSAEPDRQREALIALAIAETTLLLQYTARGNDFYTRQSAAESAAATASQIFFWSRDHDDYDADFYQGRGRSYGSYGSSSSYGDPYAYDADVMYSRSLPRSRSRNGSRSPAFPRPFVDDRPPMSSYPIIPNGSSYGSSYDGSFGSNYSGYPMNTPGLPVRGRSMSIMGPTPYGDNMQYSGMPYPYTPALTQPQTQYMHAGGMIPSQQGQVVLYTKPKKHHRHHHRSSKHKKRARSVSMEPMYIRY
ncbi:hypothetical protein EV361DRAFT_890190 [Lentinula raphanica]|nr:hypothetical protein EV361DRAFT_890190 [Lentinula raphanica]